MLTSNFTILFYRFYYLNTAVVVLMHKIRRKTARPTSHCARLFSLQDSVESNRSSSTQIEVCSRNTVKIFRLAGGNNPARPSRFDLRRGLVAQSLKFFIGQVLNVIKGAVAILIHVVGRQKDIQYRGSVWARNKFVQIAFKRIQRSAL